MFCFATISHFHCFVILRYHYYCYYYHLYQFFNLFFFSLFPFYYYYYHYLFLFFPFYFWLNKSTNSLLFSSSQKVYNFLSLFLFLHNFTFYFEFYLVFFCHWFYYGFILTDFMTVTSEQCLRSTLAVSFLGWVHWQWPWTLLRIDPRVLREVLYSIMFPFLFLCNILT